MEIIKFFILLLFIGNEWITSVLLMKFIEDYCVSYTNNTSLYNYNIRDLFKKTSIYLMPMVNPDGVDLVTGFYKEDNSIYQSFKNISLSYPSIPFPSGFKANFNGVDFKNYQPFCKVLYLLELHGFAFLIIFIYYFFNFNKFI